MLTFVDLRGSNGDLRAALAPPVEEEGPVAAVRAIIEAVRERGDTAVRELTQRFDNCVIEELRVPKAQLDVALADTAPQFRAALEYARDAITAYHETQRVTPRSLTRNGVEIRDVVRPVDRAGLYAPGGRATYPSTVLMTAVPARIAGVAEIALCVPPDGNGNVAAATLAAAALVGVDEVYRVGGAQAIAAMAYGTESIAPVDVIVGPGNIYVALAKREVAGIVGIESYAGPSEVVIVADGTARPDWVAADLLAQAEHGPGGVAVLVTWEAAMVDAVDIALRQLADESHRSEEIASTLATGGRAVLVDDEARALDVVNVIAPEHLQLMTAEPQALAMKVHNAGAVFCGPFAPAALGDYVAGVNHVLPTARAARFASALRVDDFQKHMHIVSVDEAGLRAMAPHVAAIAEVEGLDAHARSVQMRLERQ